jgi:methylenetetrahydrofolate dehydrogenase (NADP+)/methenyltetrahydrofolate cyclohydrolase
MIINGKHIAQEILSALEKERGAFGDLRLGVVMSAGDAATESFVKIKSRAAARLRVELSRIELGADANTAEAVYALQELARNTQGIIVQLPLPGSVDVAAVLAALPESHDVDALKSSRLVRPPVAGAIAEVFTHAQVAAADKRAVVVGAGVLVGKPAQELLEDLGAAVEVVTKNDGSLAALRQADIVVLGAGEPGLVKPDMLKPGVVLIDAGTSEAGGRLAGDADPACAEVAGVFTPVPGGIGPIAVAMIFKNLFTLAKENPSR